MWCVYACMRARVCVKRKNESATGWIEQYIQEKNADREKTGYNFYKLLSFKPTINIQNQQNTEWSSHFAKTLILHLWHRGMLEANDSQLSKADYRLLTLITYITIRFSWHHNGY